MQSVDLEVVSVKSPLREGTTRVRVVARNIFGVTERAVLDLLWTDFEESGPSKDGELSVWDFHMRVSGTNMEPRWSSRGVSENRTVKGREAVVELLKFLLVTNDGKDVLQAVFVSLRNGDVG